MKELECYSLRDEQMVGRPGCATYLKRKDCLAIQCKVYKFMSLWHIVMLVTSLLSLACTVSRWRNGLVCLQRWPCRNGLAVCKYHGLSPDLRPVEFFSCNTVSLFAKLKPNANLCAMFVCFCCAFCSLFNGLQ